MKFKNVFTAAALMVSVAATANTTNPVEDPVTIQEEANMVSLSVLNTAQKTYKVYVYNEEGEIIYKSILGRATSLGQQFDFSDVPAGEYTFKLITNGGESYSYSVNTGA